MAVAIFVFVIAAAFLVVALVGPYRLYWRARPHAARQPSDAALAVGRVAAFGVAGIFAFGGCQVQTAIDKGAWSASEIRAAAEEAADSMAADTQIRRDPTAGYTSLIKADIMRAGEGQGPLYRVSVERAGDGQDYEISGGGSATTVCMHVTEEESAEGGVFVPGADGGSGSSIPEYDVTATVDEGAC